MLTRRKLESYIELTGFSLGQIEKDYLQHIFLLNFYRKIKDDLIFKGGTALQKTYGLPRFSEDLDFSLISKNDIDYFINSVLKNMKIFGCETSSKKIKGGDLGINYVLKIKGPLFDGTELSHSFIRLDISKRDEVQLPVDIRTITPIYEDLPPYTAPVMANAEIMAEKIRAILTRDNARDIYDLWFLIQKKNKVSVSLINSKLKFYKKIFDREEFEKNIEKKKRIWDQEMRQLIPVLISFKEIKKGIISKQFIY